MKEDLSDRADETIYAFPSEGVQRARGMTLRDYFAGQAIVGMMAAHAGTILPQLEIVVGAAFQIADAMMKARER